MQFVLTVTTLPRNPACRCAHETPAIERLDVAPDRTTVGDLLSRAGASAAPYLRAVGDVFVRRLVCPAADCEGSRRLFRLSARLTAAGRSCPRCGCVMVARGLDLDDVLGASDCSPAMLRRSLRSLGFRGGDVLVVGGAGDGRHYELAE